MLIGRVGFGVSKMMGKVVRLGNVGCDVDGNGEGIMEFGILVSKVAGTVRSGS